MEYIDRLEKTLGELENNSGKLANLPELVKGVNELIALYRETNESVVKSKESLDEIEVRLRERIEELNKELKLEQDAKDELLNNVRSVLTANNREQLDAVNSVTSVVNNKIAITESNIIVKTTEIDNDLKLISARVAENSTKIESLHEDISGISNKMCELGDKISNDLAEIKTMMPVIKRTHIFSIVAAILALCACVLNILM